jgi:hypothetical protein
MSPAGRPPRAEENADYVLRVRLTSAERDELERRAAKAKMSVSEYVRAKALAGKRRK